ncbi:MAG: PDZ domain-containing protein [Clostridia bacterium]|nr:PDZ domain-containing protein [Clostridia bacterium]
MPVNSSMNIIDQLIEYGVVKRPYIGIEGRNISEELSKKYDYPIGIYIEKVTPDSAAEEAGLKPEDVIVSINDEDVSTVDELNEVKNKCEVGDEVSLKVYRNKEYIDIKLTLGDTPSEDGETLQDYYNNYDNYYKNYFSNPFGY